MLRKASESRTNCVTALFQAVINRAMTCNISIQGPLKLLISQQGSTSPRTNVKVTKPINATSTLAGSQTKYPHLYHISTCCNCHLTRLQSNFPFPYFCLCHHLTRLQSVHIFVSAITLLDCNLIFLFCLCHHLSRLLANYPYILRTHFQLLL